MWWGRQQTWSYGFCNSSTGTNSICLKSWCSHMKYTVWWSVGQVSICFRQWTAFFLKDPKSGVVSLHGSHTTYLSRPIPTMCSLKKLFTIFPFWHQKYILGTFSKIQNLCSRLCKLHWNKWVSTEVWSLMHCFVSLPHQNLDQHRFHGCRSTVHSDDMPWFQ
jgi:hypothetical protein